MTEVIGQSAALSMYTYLQVVDAERIDGLYRKAERLEAAGLGATATWNGNEFEKAQVAFRQTLRSHPDPELMARIHAEQDAAASRLLISLEHGGKGPRSRERADG